MGNAASLPAVDGRLRRSERSREAIVRALIELVGEGSLRPTAQQVAERAGVGIRPVFRHYSDMETLYTEMDARLRAEIAPLLREGADSGSLLERARALVHRRADCFERIAPYKRAANLQGGRSAVLQSQHGALVRELRSDLLRCLPELTDAPAELTDAIELAASFEAWDRLRSDQRLSRRRALAAMERAVTALAHELG